MDRRMVGLAVLVAGCSQQPAIYNQVLEPYNSHVPSHSGNQVTKLREACTEAGWRDAEGCAKDAVLLAEFYAAQSYHHLEPYGMSAPDSYMRPRFNPEPTTVNEAVETMRARHAR